MSDLTKQERTAIEAVARRFSATWEKGSDPPDAYVVVAGKRIAVEIATLKRRVNGQGDAGKTRLRFDKVATRLIERLQEKGTIHGNRVQIRLLRGESERAPKMIGFVHNPDSDPDLLLNMTRELLELISAEAGGPATRLAGDRWLVVISAEGFSRFEAYRYIYSQLRMSTDFRKILMVSDDGRVGVLAG